MRLSLCAVLLLAVRPADTAIKMTVTTMNAYTAFGKTLAVKRVLVTVTVTVVAVPTVVVIVEVTVAVAVTVDVKVVVAVVVVVVASTPSVVLEAVTTGSVEAKELAGSALRPTNPI